MLSSGLFTCLFGLGYIYDIHNLAFYISVQVRSHFLSPLGWQKHTSCCYYWSLNVKLAQRQQHSGWTCSHTHTHTHTHTLTRALAEKVDLKKEINISWCFRWPTAWSKPPAGPVWWPASVTGLEREGKEELFSIVEDGLLAVVSLRLWLKLHVAVV